MTSIAFGTYRQLLDLTADGLVVDGIFRLMELELIDPFLFVADAPAAAQCFAAICRAVL